ncbi:MAG: hypothetical protein NT178_16500 [Proteobacteria bacterium]|nr:hypothetical protein [Pseudomonadota bacterium]
MLSTIESPQEKRGLEALDPDLPFLAAEVSVDVSNMLSGVSNDQTAMRSLADKLLHSLKSCHGVPLRSRMDMATLTVLGEAVETIDKQSLKNVGDLLSKASQIANVLARENPKEDLAALEQAGHFCVALSRAAAAYSESIRDLGPSHPFRS